MKRSLVLLLALGACVSPPKRVAPPIVQPRPAPAPLPLPPPVAWEDRPRTQGNWIFAGDVANFSSTAGAPLLSLRCMGPADLVFTYFGASAGPMAIRTTTLARTLQLTPSGQVRIAANDPLLDAMIYSRGRFMVSVAGQPDLIIPPWPEVARVVEDCRR